MIKFKSFKRVPFLFLANLLLIPTFLSIFALANPQVEAASSLTFTDLGTHPQAAAQSTAVGKTIAKLEIYNNQIIAGYGDWNTNTGPIAINPYDLTSETYVGSQLSVPAEALYTMKVIDGKLYIPGIDPTCSGTCSAGYALGLPNGTWQMKTPISAEHVLGVATLTGTDIWLFGSAGGSTSTAWRSTDDGTTWNVVKTTAVVPNGNNSERYYWGAALGGTMYTQSNLSPNQLPIQSFDGTTWTDTNVNAAQPLCIGSTAKYNPVIFNNQIICLNTAETGVNGSSFGGLFSYSGTGSVTSYPNGLVGLGGDKFDSAEVQSFKDCNPKDTYVQGSYLYVLCTNVWSGTPTAARILRTTNLTDWETLANVPATSASLAVDASNTHVYVGTTSSKLFSANLPAANSTLPVVDITSPTSSDTANDWIVEASATDDQAVTRMQLLVDGQLISEQYSDTFNDTLVRNWDNTWQMAEGAHVLTVRAYDESGNYGESSVDITADAPPAIQEYADIYARSMSLGKDSRGNIVYLGYTNSDEDVAIIGILNPDSGIVDQIQLPDGVSPVNNVFVDHADNIWFSDCTNNLLYKYGVSNDQFTPYELSSICSDAFNSNIVEDQDHTVWYAPSFSDVMNGVTSAGDVIDVPLNIGTVFLSLAYDAQSDSLYASLVSDDFSTGGIARYTAEDGFTLIETASPQAGLPITVDDDGNIWLQNFLAGTVMSKVSPNGNETSYNIPLIEVGVVTGPSYGADSLWYFTDLNILQKMSTGDGEVSMYYLNRYISALLASNDGTAWAIDNFSNSVIHIGAASGAEEPEEPEEPSINDANGDGLDDATQDNVSSFLNTSNNKLEAIELSNTCTILDSGTSKESIFTAQDPGYDYPNDFIKFSANCSVGSTTVKHFYYDVSKADVIVRKHSTKNNSYFTVPGSTLTEQTINGRTVTVATFQIVDNGPLDMDDALGVISDPAGLARSVVGAPKTGLNTN